MAALLGATLLTHGQVAVGAVLLSGGGVLAAGPFLWLPVDEAWQNLRQFLDRRIVVEWLDE
jgi:hypothetical protein